MIVEWTRQALRDLDQLHDFLVVINPAAADDAIRSLVAASNRLVDFPHVGERVGRYAPREVRRIVVGRYELRYELVGSRIVIVQLWHSREHR